MFKKIVSLAALLIAIGVMAIHAENTAGMTRVDVDAFVASTDKNLSTFRMESRDVTDLITAGCTESTMINAVKSGKESKITETLYFNGIQLVKITLKVIDPRFGYSENIYIENGTAIFSSNSRNSVYLTENTNTIDQAVKAKMIALSCNINLLTNQ